VLIAEQRIFCSLFYSHSTGLKRQKRTNIILT